MFIESRPWYIWRLKKPQNILDNLPKLDCASHGRNSTYSKIETFKDKLQL